MTMKKLIIHILSCALAFHAGASWYWPFGSDKEEERTAPRLSALMEPATAIIDDAADLAAEGKISEAVEKYREALMELDKIERENPERAQKPEFSTLRNKRAYVNAAIDSLLMSQVQQNAKAVAVSDTSALEKKLAAEKKAARAAAEDGGKSAAASGEKAQPSSTGSEAEVAPRRLFSHRAPANARERAMVDIARGDYKAAEISIREILAEKPNSPVGLNLKAAMEARQGKFKEAERTLDQAIMSNPRNHQAYYNMARLMLAQGDRSPARRYYETGRSLGGDKDRELEELLK
jgi:tetratricopeptide (TPR) repeat protein